MSVPELVAASDEVALQLLYFTSTSLAADGRTLVAIGETGGMPDLYRVDLASGAIRPLTANRDGVMRSYVYFDGTPYRGFGKASVSFDAERGLVYYLQGREIRVVDLDGNDRLLGHYPEGQVTAFTHVSADGKLLCVPTTDAAAFSEDDAWSARDHGIDARVQRLGLTSYLRIYDTQTGAEIAAEPVPSAWVTHVQFSPTDASLIAYNHEWPGDCGIRRVWLWDGRQHRQLRPEGGSRSRNDWTCHEMWERDGRAVIYHGRYIDGRAFIGRVAIAGGEPVEIALPPDWTRYGHFTVGPDETRLVSDGYYSAGTDDDARVSPWLSRLDVDWAARSLRWRTLARTDSSWDSQDSHPHPIYDHAGKFIYFTSDRGGRRAIYRVAANAEPLADVLLPAS
jgi:hypothetical protein